MTQKEIALKLLEEKNDWIPSYGFVCKNTIWGWLGTSGDRRARQLVDEGKAQRRKNGKYTEFRIIRGNQLTLC